ncbi:hypothetical protein QQ045_027811 [Rhodiola kirilowii]
MESKHSIRSSSQVTKELNSDQGDSEKRDTYSGKANKTNDVDLAKGNLLSKQKNKIEDGGQHLESVNVAPQLMGKGAGDGSSDSGYAEDKKKKRKGLSSRHEVTSDDDSYELEEDGKDAKRRRKEEKRLRREKRHQRHEEKRRKKEEKRSVKHKSRKDDDSGIEKKIHEKSEEEEEKKKLEIELRNKALESLKAKRGVGH